MNLQFQNLIELKGGLSNKKVFRKYEKKISKIVMDFSQAQADFENFLNVYKILKKINICIPKIYEIHFKKNLIIMEDFGDKTFHSLYEESKLYNLLKLAVDNLIIIQNSIISEDLKKLKKYTFSDLKIEISEFIDYYIPYKNIDNFSSNHFYDTWENTYIAYNFNFDSFAHKDFEFINLIFIDKNSLHYKCGIIDFQNAFIGFKGWDLFTILENPRICFSRKFNEELLKYFYENTYINIDFHLFRKQYYILNLARQTRLLGKWIKLFKDGNKQYINYLTPTQKRIVFCLENIQDNKLKKIYTDILNYNA